MFSFRVTYLTGRVEAGSRFDRTKLEWPPHPLRLFTALIAAYYETDAPASARDALLWLEAQEPPSMTFGPVTKDWERTPVVSYVPLVESADGLQPRTFPTAGLSDPNVYFTYTNEPSAEVLRDLTLLAQRVPFLGRSSCFVNITIELDPPKPTWTPQQQSNEHSETLRVPRAGTLIECETAHRFGTVLRSFPQRAYGPPEDQQATAESPFDMGVLYELPSCQQGIRQTLAVSDLIRRFVLSAGPVASCVSGHPHNAPHVAFVPLPFVGHEHATGRIMGCAVCIPKVADVDSVYDALARTLEQGELRTEQGAWPVRRVGLDVRAVTLQAQTWTKPSRFYATVTPTVLDRFTRRAKDPMHVLPKVIAAGVIADSLERDGYPRPIRVMVDNYAVFPGTPRASDFDMTRRKERVRKPSHHAILEFPIPVRGPVISGSMRSFGLGLFRAVSEDMVQSFLEQA